GGFVPPSDTALPLGAAWQPIDNAWEYDPAADSWKSLPPLPTRRGSAVAGEVGGKIYTIGGATTVDGPVLNDSQGRLGDPKAPFFPAFGPARVLSVTEVGGPPRPGFIPAAPNTDVVEEYDPLSDTWNVPRERMPTARSGGVSGTDGRRIYVAGGEVTT